jgi:predicted PurR-regulated permease PerM
MSVYLIIQLVLTVALLLLIAVAIAVLVKAYRLLGSLNLAVSEVNKNLPEILERLKQTLLGLNMELDKVEQIVGSIQDVRDKVQATRTVLQNAVGSPLAKASALFTSLRAIVTGLSRRKGS